MNWWHRSAKGRRFGLMLLVGIPIIAYVLLNPHGIIQRVRLELAKREMEEKLREAEVEQQQLQDLSKRLENDKHTIEKIAREKYGMLRAGETVYRVQVKK
jgi:cell division protein FtsB